MEIRHIQKNIHTSPRKLRLVADLVRKMLPTQALVTLSFTNKAAAPLLAKAIKTAIANAKQQSLSEDALIFKSLEVNEQLKMRRMRAAGRTHRHPYVKQTSQVRIILTNEFINIKKGGKTQNGSEN